MERQRNRRITTNNNWYIQNVSKSATYQRKAKTASGKRRNYNYENQSKIIDISDQSLREFSDSPPKNQQRNRPESKQKTMIEMVKDAFEQYISLDDCNMVS